MKDVTKTSGSIANPDSMVTKPSPSRKNVPQMFDRVAHRYDLLNRLLSFGRDVAWRRRLAKCLPDRSDLEVLDLATGTADVLLTLFKTKSVSLGVGVDMAFRMLEVGKDKIVRRGKDMQLMLVRGDVGSLPFARDSFDVVSIAFGIRNFVNLNGSLEEIMRVLRPGGRLLVLEFSLPGNRAIRALYLFYFRYILPRVGALISGDSYAYRYLNETVESFPYGKVFCELIGKAGFDNVNAIPLTFGVATIYCGECGLSDSEGTD